MRIATRGITLINVLLAGWIACAILAIAHTWVSFTIEVVDRGAHAAAREAERGTLAALLREDFGSASRLIPDQGGTGFALERPSEASVSGRSQPDFVVYDCVPRSEGTTLVRTVFLGQGGAPEVRRLTMGVERCRAAAEGSAWRVQVTWRAGPGRQAESMSLVIGARVPRRE